MKFARSHFIFSKWKTVLAASALSLALTACGGTTSTGTQSPQGTSTSSSDTLKVGMILSATGTFAPLTESIRNGFQLYLDQHNGMLGGRKVEIKFEDDQEDPQVALRKYRQLVTSDKVDILVGPISSAVAYALRDGVEKDKIVLIDPNAAANDLSWKQKSDYIYRVSFSNWQNGSSVAKYIAQNIGKSAVTIAPDYPAGREVIQAFKAAFEASGGKVVKELYPKLGTNDFATYLTTIAQTKPDVVYSFETGSDGIRFVKQYADFGLKGKIPLTGTLELGDNLILDPAGDAAEGIISGVLYTPWLENNVNQTFVTSYQKKYNKLPNIFAVDGYDAAQVIDLAITKAGSTRSDDLIKVLKGISFNSPRGPVTIDPKTNNPIENFYVAKNVKLDGKIVPQVSQTIPNVTMPETPSPAAQ
ncbi:ABC transporter substrate-binding protein [Kyrpidia sp.]|uniref:ABC transporter substrate-binding protein n=1 Tax=Kyrpidia sp. TaxID=2073077 RepID=UPI0025889477|nr:ABC transporter substrate-binding protein [Kyrpidia sp.]